MPRLQLTQQFVDNPPIIQHKTKTDYFDTRRTFSRQLEVLSAYRRKGKQSMVVKHVTVQEGGQAIVGNLGDREGR